MFTKTTFISTMNQLYGAFPSSEKHITFFHPKDERINSSSSMTENIGKYVKVIVYNDIIEWSNKDGERFAYKFCVYELPNGTLNIGHVSQKVDSNGGDPKENKQHSENNWITFRKTYPNAKFETFTSFGCLLRSSRHPKALENKSLANEILSVFDVRVLINKDGTITPFGEKLAQTQLHTVPILISDIGVEGDADVEKTKDVKDILQSQFSKCDFITFDDVAKRDFKHIVSDHIKDEHIENVIVTSPPQ